MPRRIRSGLQDIALEHINDAIIAIDRDGKVIIFNRIASQIFSIPQKEAEGKSIWDVLKFSQFNKILMQTVKEPDAKAREQIILFPDNRLFQIRIFRAKQEESKLLGAIAVLKDLSELSRIEKAVNKYVANVSHELKTPLTCIKGYVETLLEGSYYSNPEIIQRFLHIINEETNRMTRLILGMLQMATLESGQGKTELKAASIYPLLSDAAKVFQPVAQQKNIEIQLEVPEDLPPVIINPDKIKQVFINIIDNAIKFTGLMKKGTVRIEARDESKHLRINIIDTGIGIEEKHLDKIFERFYRIKEGPSAELGGTGLGLAITKEIVEEHKGTITAESQPGKGSKFSITLPLAAH